MPTCHTLRAEYQDAPRGVGTRHPRLTWQADETTLEWQLEVAGAGSTQWAHAGVGHPTSPVEYAGPALRSNTAYTWRVRGRGTAGWSEWAASSFTTALLDPDDWNAPWAEPAQDDTVVERWSIVDWIRGCGPADPPDRRLHPPQRVRQRVDLPPGIVRARLYASARGVYEPRVNGRAITDEVLAPGFDSYLTRTSVHVYDVTDAVAPGANVIGMTVADGWWAGRIGLTGSSAQFGTRTAVTWQLHVDTRDGGAHVYGIDASARSAPGPWDYADLFIGERYDARRAGDAWSAPGFDDTEWMPVRLRSGAAEVLVPFTGDPVRRVQELPARSVRATPDGVIVDFGQVIAGRVRLTVRDAARGDEITLGHTEALLPDGTWFENIAGINKDQTDVYVAAGDAVETYEPTFTFHGFRYVRIQGLAAPPSASDVAAVVLASDLPAAGGFACSDARLTRLHENVVWSQQANFLSIPTDCPQRERAGWTGDLQVFAPAATNNQHVLTFVERWLANLRADQLDDGRIPITSPRSPFDAEAAAHAQGVGGIVAAAGWSDAIAFVPWALWQQYGDRRVLEENWDALWRWTEYQRQSAQAESPDSIVGRALSSGDLADQALLYNSGLHFGDWLAPSTLEGRPFHEAIGVAPALTRELVAPMFQAQTLTIAARVAEVLGRAETAELARRAAGVRAAFARQYVDGDGDLPVRLQGVYVLALAFDMVPAPLRARTAARLAELVRERGDRLDTGFLSVPYLLDVLWDTGHRDLARRVLWQDEAPSWLYAVDHGATTVWESWTAVAADGTPGQTSLNHYALGCVDDWLFRRIAGIAFAAADDPVVRIEPDLECGLEWVRAHRDTLVGRVQVEWRRGGAVDVVVPPGCRAELILAGTSTALAPGRSSVAVVDR